MGCPAPDNAFWVRGILHSWTETPVLSPESKKQLLSATAELHVQCRCWLAATLTGVFGPINFVTLNHFGMVTRGTDTTS